MVPEAIGHDLHFDFGVGPVAACGVIVRLKEVEAVAWVFRRHREGWGAVLRQEEVQVMCIDKKLSIICKSGQQQRLDGT